MRIFALELNNDIKGIEERKEYIEGLISKLDKPELVVLPELALCSYMASQEMWYYADDKGKDTTQWAVEMAQKYSTYIGVGYLDKEGDDYFNRYMIAGSDGVCGFTTKSEGEAAAFKRGRFKSTISTPFGTVGVGICYDSRRKIFYDNVKNEKLSLILFPHGAPADPKKPNKERQENELRCMKYVEAFGVPVVYVNSIGKLEYMPGMMGRLMKMSKFRMNGMSKIYADDLREISSDMPEVVAAEVEVSPKQRAKDIRFYGNDILNSNWIFRKMILEPDTRMGIRRYEEGVGRRKKDIIALILVMIPAAFLIVALGIRIGLSINRDHFLAGDDLYAGLMQTSFALFGLSVFPGILLSILGIVSGKISGASQYKVIGGLEVIVEILVICSFFYAGAHF